MDIIPLYLLVAPLTGLICNAVAQMLLSHALHGRRLGLSITLSALCGIGVAMALTFIALGFPMLPATEKAALMAMNLIIAFALAFCYWAFLNLNITSLRIRLLKELLRAEGRALPRSQLLSTYQGTEVLERRLARLQAMGQIKDQDGSYRMANRKLIWLARAVDAARKIILPKK